MVDGHAAAMEMQPLMTRQPDEWEFPRDRLTITTVLGAGAFGVVMRGLAQGIKGSVGQITVAVKTVRGENRKKNNFKSQNINLIDNFKKMVVDKIKKL